MTLSNTSFWLQGNGDATVPTVAAQGASTDVTTTTTLTVAQVLTGIINYTGAGHTLTLPTAALIDAALPNLPADTGFDFSVTATTGTATLAVGAGITAGTGCRLTTAAATVSRYRLRKTAAGAYTLYLVG